jgi:ADP-heptose:LPS heptosyltransferase
LIRGGALGDFVLTVPALACLRERWPDLHLELLGYPRHAALAVEAGLVDAVRSLDDPATARLFIPGELHPAWAKYLARFDAIVSALRDAEGILERNLAASGRPVILAEPRVPEDRHAAEAFAGFLAAFGLEPKPGDLVPRVRVPGLPAPEPGRIAFHPGSGSPAKALPPERALDLAAALLESAHGLDIILGPAEQASAPRYRDLAARDPRVRLLEGLPVLGLARELGRAAVFVGHDSGVSHLAAALGRPGVYLFGNSSPACWAPRSDAPVRIIYRGGRWRPGDLVEGPSPNGLARVDLDLVLAEARDLLSSAPQSPSPDPQPPERWLRKEQRDGQPPR